MCLGGVSGRGADAQWKQTGSIARGNLPWRALECRLLCQMNCTKGRHLPLKVAGGTLVVFRQIIARGSLPWSTLERRLPSAESHLICTHLVYLCVYVYRLILFQVWVNYLRFVFEEGFMQLPDDSLQI